MKKETNDQNTTKPMAYDAVLGTVDQDVSSKYYGVCWFNKKNKWKASIYIQGKDVYLGIYAIEEEAAFAFNVAFELFSNKHHTITNHVELGDIQANDVRDSVIERLLNKGYIINCA